MKKVAIVILNWNGRHYLEKFLPGVVEHSKSRDVEVVIADNASTDDSVPFIESNFQNIVRLIRLDQNYGFAGGYNKALAQVDAQYYVILNSDVEVSPGWLEPLIELMDNNKVLAACMPKIKSYHEREFFEYAGAAGGYMDKNGYAFCRGRLFGHVEKDTGQYDDQREIFWATGACMFVQSKSFHELGGFDADFFAHMEEIDLCWRILNKGGKIMYHPGSVVYHVGGGTLSKGNPWKTYLNHRNNLFLLFKNLPKSKLFFRIFIRLLYDFLSGVLYLGTFHFKDFGALVKAHWHFFGAIGKLREKRRMIKSQGIPGLVYRKSLVYQYYFFHKRKYNELKQIER